MTGRLIGVVGPSGAGKDTVMEALVARDPRYGLVRRVITRPQDSGGEAHEAVSATEFARRRADGAFCLNWDAHGLSYGIPAEALDAVRHGRDMLVNLSRSVLDQAAGAAPHFVVLHITARPDTLARRLSARGREGAAQIHERLGRTAPGWPAGVEILTVENEGLLDDTVAQVIALL
ncbi:MAG: phosphonate metabolism protein/1,5-bisphosphokinase (PRPP-forming) PhnN, partial [Pseudomonadota bacterium]